MDRGQKETEKVIRKVEERIDKEYSQAIKEIEAELKDYLRRFQIKDEKWQEWVENGTKTEQEYKQWRMGQMAVGRRWSEQKDAIAEELFKVNEKAKETYQSSASEIFAENVNFATYELERDAKINTSFTLYSKDSVDRLIKEDPDILPGPGRKVSREIAEGKAVRWNRQQLQSVMIQGILQGDSIPKLATRLANTVGDRNRKAAIRNARTMATAAQNAGRVNAYKRAESKGVEMEQMWLATMDNRTRHSHRWLDHEVRPVGEAFSNGCEYPGDPKGDPAEIYNCRCSLRGVVKGLERRSGQFRDDSKIDGMTYEQWRNAKPKSQDIQHQEKVSEAMRKKHIREYGGKTTSSQIGHEYTHVSLPEKKQVVITREERVRQSGLLERNYVELSEKEYKIALKESQKAVSKADAQQLAKHKKADGTYGGYVATTNYKNINIACREKTTDQLDSDDKKTLESLRRATKSYELKQDTLVTRYVNADYLASVFGIRDKNGFKYDNLEIMGNRRNAEDVLKQMDSHIGKIVTEQSVLSTSMLSDKNVVKNGKAVRIRVEAPEGTKCYLPNNKKESECIFSEGTDMYIKSISLMPDSQYSAGILEIFCTIVNEVP